MNSQSPLLSVIVPIYKVEPFLNRCITSIVGQSYGRLEIILVDDGSPDNCPAMVDEWAARDERIKVVHKLNAGLGMARNSGLEVASGDYVMFVDSDDYIAPDMCEKLLSEIVDAEADMVVCGFYQQFSKDGDFTVASDYSERVVIEGEEAIKRQAVRYMPDEGRGALNCGVWHAIYSHAVITPFYSEREACPEDITFIVAATLKSRRIVCIPDALYYYCCNEQSLSRSFRPDYFERFVNTISILQRIYADYGVTAPVDYYLFNQLINLQRSRFSVKLCLAKKMECYRSILAIPALREQLKPLSTTLRYRKNRLNLKVIRSSNPWIFYAYSKFDKWVVCNKLGLNRLKARK